MKKKYTLLLLLILSSVVIFAQSPAWKWAKAVAGSPFPPNGKWAKSVASDVNGNCYVTGSFSAPNIIFGKDTLTASAGQAQLFFIAKYDSLGNVLWAKSAKGATYAEGSSICTDAFGNICVTGFFTGATIDFDSIQLTSVSRTHLFIVKYNPLGEVLWARTSKGNTLDRGSSKGNSISTDGRGSVYVTGAYETTITFDTITLTSANDMPRENMFIVKYDNTGNVRWAKTAYSKGANAGNDIVAEVDGSTYVTGFFSQQITFGNIHLTANTHAGVFIVKYDNNGNELWGRHSDGYPSAGVGSSLSLDGNNNLYVTGYFDGPILNFGTDTVFNTTKGFDQRDVFIAKFNNSGNILWLRGAGSEITDEGVSISTDKDGNSYVTGYFMNAMNLDKVHIYSEGLRDGFIAKYNSNGNAVWAKKIGGAATEYANGVSVNALGHVYVVGSFISTFLDFDAIKLLNSDKWGNGNSANIFIAQIDGTGKIGINEKHKQQFQLSAYPNPFTSFTTIKFNAIINDATLTVYTSYGKKVKTIPNISGNNIKIEREQLAPGLYFYQLVTNDNSIAAGKLVITD